MRFMAAIFVFALLLYSAHTAYADQATAKEVARINNCPPKKIEVYQQSLGIDGKTVYHVDCSLPKLTDTGSAPPADAVLIQCDASICTLLKSLSATNRQ